MQNNSYKIILLFCSLLVSGQALSVNQENAEIQNYPITCQEAIDLILENLNEEDRSLLNSIEKDELKSRSYLIGWGKGIRDGFGLNNGNFPLMQSCQQRRENAAFHPVDISAIIMEEVWQALKLKI